MKEIYVIGDMDTVSALRLSGVGGVIADRDTVPSRFEEVIRNGKAGIVIMTSDLSGDLHERITEVNLAVDGPVVIEIPGIDETEGFHKSVVGYIAEALGISLDS
jgi:vacuolar-type H+-ATPase subunit F/Vma7